MIFAGCDVGMELGSLQKTSVAVLIWTSDCKKISDNRITLIGPDVGEGPENTLPLGKVVLV